MNEKDSDSTSKCQMFDTKWHKTLLFTLVDKFEFTIQLESADRRPRFFGKATLLTLRF